MTALVTGANGFIGSTLCRHLLRRGHRVVGMVRPSRDRGLLSGLSALRIVEGDITDRASLAAAMDEIEVVYHVAGYASDWGSWKAFHAGNVEGVGAVVETARERGVRRVVHLSSVSVYGFPGGIDIAEDATFTPRPRDRYITSKVAGERLAMSFNGRGIEVAAIRPGGVYGRNDRTTTRPLAAALQAGKFAYVDHGRYFMAPLYVDNLVDMVLLAGASPAAAGEAFNAVDDGLVTWRQYIEWMCADLGCAPPRLSVPAGIAWPAALLIDTLAKSIGKKQSPLINAYRVRAAMKHSHYSTDKAKRLLRWRPAVSTRDGLRIATDWYLGRSAMPDRPLAREALSA